MRKLPITEIPRCSVEDFKNIDKIPLVIVLDNVRSLHNVGSVFRTCDAFACESIFLTGITGKPPHREISKTALGTTDTVTWRYFENAKDCIIYLIEDGYIPISLEIAEGSVLIEDFIPEKKQKYALILGNEVTGVEQDIIDLCKYCIEIPQYGTKHSLNVSVSAGIAIWELSKKMR
jgi:23S rRNA (guanosine2251-2'-O)-methyltransferase